MKKTFSFLIIGILLFVAFVNRGVLKDLWFEYQKQDIPEAVALSELQKVEDKIEVKIKEDVYTLANVEEVDEIEEKMVAEVNDVPEEESSKDAPDEKTVIIPEAFNLKMQFFSQAPFANWDMPYQEACEEASVLIAMNYVRNAEVSKEEFNMDLLEIVEFEKEYFGAFEHTTVQETKEIIEQLYKYPHVSIIENPTVEDIKKEISRGNPVLVPLAGQHIGNPYYTAPGPVYHFLVIKGYTQTHFITHDVGTRRGEDFTYPFETIMKNIHDWHEEIMEGERRVLVVEVE